MCDPFTVATAVALTGASYAANQVASNQQRKARDGAMTAERIRQKGFREEAAALNENSRGNYENFAAKQQGEAQQLGDYLAGQTMANEAASALPASSSEIVVGEQGKQRGKAKAFTDQQAKARAELRAFGDLMGENNRQFARNAGKVGQVGSFMKGSSDVLGLELDKANEAGKNARLFGDLLALGGQIATGRAMSGSSVAAGKAAATPASGYTVGGGADMSSFYRV